MGSVSLRIHHDGHCIYNAAGVPQSQRDTPIHRHDKENAGGDTDKGKDRMQTGIVALTGMVITQGDKLEEIALTLKQTKEMIDYKKGSESVTNEAMISTIWTMMESNIQF